MTGAADDTEAILAGAIGQGASGKWTKFATSRIFAGDALTMRRLSANMPACELDRGREWITIRRGNRVGSLGLAPPRRPPGRPLRPALYEKRITSNYETAHTFMSNFMDWFTVFRPARSTEDCGFPLSAKLPQRSISICACDFQTSSGAMAWIVRACTSVSIMDPKAA